MRIVYLELENIKSYAGVTRLDFTGGLNAVCGHNGSGKTTVLEAIGWALFDSLAYKRDGFLREGQRSGTVRVGVTASDGRLYEVVRHVGASAGHFVYDLETRTRVTERKATLEWIRAEALSLEGEVDLEALFENAVGVPQGTMTADFLKGGLARKAIFDPLLRVEEYRRAYEELNGTRSYLEKRLTRMEGEIERLDEAVGRLEVVREQAREARRELERLETETEGVAGELVTLGARARELDALEHRIADARGVLRDAEHESARRAEYRTQRATERTRAAEARELATRAEAGHRAVLAARERLSRLETERRERDDLAGRLSIAQSDRREAFGAIQQLDRRQQEATQARLDAERLEADVRRQLELETRLERARHVVARGEKVDGEIGRLRACIRDLEADVIRVETELGTAIAARDRVATGTDPRNELEAVTRGLGELDSIKAQLTGVTDEGTDLRAQRDRLSARSDRREMLRRELDQVTPVALLHDELQARLQTIREEQTRVATAIEYQGQARAALTERQCPLLDLRCPAVSADPGLLERLDVHDAALAGRQVTLEAERAEAEALVRRARAARERQSELQLEVARIDTVVDGMAEIDARLAACRERYRDLEGRLRAAPDLERRSRELRERQACRQRDEQLVSTLSNLETGLARACERLHADRMALEELTTERETIQRQEEEARDLEATLMALDRPRERQRSLLDRAAELPRIEAESQRQQERSSEAAGRVKAISAQLERFARLDAEIEAENRLAEHHREAYETYVRALPLAETLAACEAALAEAEAMATTAGQAEEEARRLLVEAQRRYDATVHAQVRERVRVAEAELARLETARDYRQRDADRIAAELTDLEARERELVACRGERDRLERTQRVLAFVRDTIKAAGPTVTGALLRGISEGANDIYAEIMDDHAAELRWDSEYDIIVQRGAEERHFAQLSGGEQMSAALAVRLALLREMSDVDFAFFDEPTQNMDLDRRTNLAEQIRAVRGFEQLIVISHDDTFEHHTDHVIRLRKLDEETVAEAG